MKTLTLIKEIIQESKKVGTTPETLIQWRRNQLDPQAFEDGREMPENTYRPTSDEGDEDDESDKD